MALPKYKISIDDEYSNGEDLGWNATAFTSRPAIMVKGMAFESQENVIKEQFFADKLKYRIAGPAMIPMQIYRCMDDEEFYVEFTAKEIEKIHQKYMKNFKNKNMFNLEHDSTQIVPAYICDVLLLDTQAKVDMVLKDYGIKVPIGTLFIITQITDKEYYHRLVENNQVGYSIEGFLGLALSDIKQKYNKMEENELKLPEGAKFQIGDKWYEVKDGVIVEVIEAEMAEETTVEEEVKEEEIKASEDVVEEDKKEEEVAMAEEVVTETPTEEPVAEEVTGEFYSKEEIDAKFDELYKLIAELKAEEADEEMVNGEEVALSIHDRLNAFNRFAAKRK